MEAAGRCYLPNAAAAHLGISTATQKVYDHSLQSSSGSTDAKIIYLAPFRSYSAALSQIKWRYVASNPHAENCIPYPYSGEDAEKFIGIMTEATARHGHPVHFAIRDDDVQLIGGCGFDGLSYGHRAEIGYWLAKPYWGQSIMTDVVGSACSFALGKWKLVRFTAHVFDFNEASARVLEKCGFELEGLLRKHHRKDGKFLDSKLYALVK